MQQYLLIVSALLANEFAHAAEENAPTQARNVTIEDAVSFEEIDQDRDGRLSPDEARQSEELTTYFVVWDTDQNGQLDADEIRAGRNNASTSNDAGDGAVIIDQANFTVIDFETRGRFSNLDSDGDGYLAPAEWAESGVPMPFSDVDNDGNGRLDQSELANVNREPRAQAVDVAEREIGRQDVATWEDWQDDDERAGPGTSRRLQMMSDDVGGGIHFTALDTDDNGMIDRLEATDNNYVLANFEEWDVDNNELLDPDEVDQARIELDMN